MEKRKSKIQNQFEAIVEERNTVIDNLNEVLNQVFSYVEYVRNDCGDLKQKDLSEMLSYELEILKKLTDINLELETLFETNHMKKWSITDKKYVNATQLAVISNIETEKKSFVLPGENALSHAANIEFSEPSIEQDGFSENDISTIRENLKEFSEKLGLNEQSISTMKDYYEKPSTSTMQYLEVSSTPDVSAAEILNENMNFEIPEKDTTGINIDDCEINSISSLETSYNSEEVVPNKLPTHSFTALEKLNNYRCEKEKPQTFQPHNMPDVQLQPVKLETPVINNNFRKKKNIKKCNRVPWNNFDGIQEKFVLKMKSPPQVGDECLFSHVETPSEFYLHIADDETSKIDELTEALNDFLNSCNPQYASKASAFEIMGNFCCAFISEYKAWYRVIILDWHLEQRHDSVLVQLIDYGNQRLVDYKNLRRIRKDFAEIPVLAIKCHFPLMYPPSSTRSNRIQDWPPETIDAMLNLSGLFDNKNKTFRITYSNYVEDLNSIAIDLYDTESGSEEKTLGEILLDLNLAEQIIDSEYENDSGLEEFIQDVDILERADNINEAVAGYDAKDEARICRFTKPDGTCFKGKNCKLEHITLPKDGFTTDKEAVFKEAMYDLYLPNIHETVIVLITGYIDICRFFVQIIKNSHRQANHIMDQTLYALIADLNSSKVIKTYEHFKVLPAIGEIVLVKLKQASKWLRAVVRELTESENENWEIQVFTVDYGDYLKVSLNDLRKIKPHHLKLPFQAIECYIDGYKMKKNRSQTEIKSFFSKNMYCRNFLAQILSSSLPLRVKLKSLNCQMDVGNELGKRDLAEKITYDIHPRDDCLLKLQ